MGTPQNTPKYLLNTPNTYLLKTTFQRRIKFYTKLCESYSYLIKYLQKGTRRLRPWLCLWNQMQIHINKYQTIYRRNDSKLRKAKSFSSHRFLRGSSNTIQRCVEILVKHLRWSFLQKWSMTESCRRFSQIAPS